MKENNPILDREKTITALVGLPAGKEKQKPIKGIFHIGRNDKCYCGSGKKFKHCCYHKHNTKTDGEL